MKVKWIDNKLTVIHMVIFDVLPNSLLNQKLRRGYCIFYRIILPKLGKNFVEKIIKHMINEWERARKKISNSSCWKTSGVF